MSVIYVTKPFLPPKAEYDAWLDRIWEREWLTNNGGLLLELEQRLREYLSVSNGCAVSNGHLGLELLLEALEIEGEVITTPFSFSSTTHAIVRKGIDPVFCDVDPMTLTIDAGKIEALITGRTTAILAVHVYGIPCAVDRIENIAKKHGLKVIYDAAHAFGVRKNGVGIANFGDASMFSFHATKLFHTIEGGMVCAKDRETLRRCALLRNFGIEDETTVSAAGGNAKMSEFQAAMGLVNLRYIHEIIDERRRITERYIQNLDGVEGLRIVCKSIPDDVEYNYGYFPVIVEDAFGISRDALYEGLKRYDIYSRRYFYPLIPDFDCYRDAGFRGLVPVARKASEGVLALPIYNGLPLDTVDLICEKILEVRKLGE